MNSMTATTKSPGSRLRELTSQTYTAPLQLEGARTLRQVLSLIDKTARESAPKSCDRYQIGPGARAIILNLMRIKSRYSVRTAKFSAP
jgi:hypothetical protein